MINAAVFGLKKNSSLISEMSKGNEITPKEVVDIINEVFEHNYNESTRNHNTVALQQKSRRKPIVSFNCDMTIRKNKIKQRLQKKLKEKIKRKNATS